MCDTLAYFVRQPNEDIQLFTLKAIGSLCIRHYDFMLGHELKTLYHRLLTEDDAPLHMRTQVNSTCNLEETKLSDYVQNYKLTKHRYASCLRQNCMQEAKWCLYDFQENREYSDTSANEDNSFRNHIT